MSLRTLLPAMALCGLVSTPAFAARDFTPQAGLWVIPSEVDGKPGRGFSLDVQGNTAFVQVFNYEKSGAATFHTAVGKLDGTTLTAPLLRFKGGRYLGGPAQDAVEDGTVGNVTIAFTDGLNGTVQFPGEPPQPIARFLVPEKQPLWWTQFPQAPSAPYKEGWRRMQWTATAADGTRHVWDAYLVVNDTNQLSLGLTPRVDGDTSGGAFNCQFLTDTQVFDCTTTSKTEGGMWRFESSVPPALLRVRFRVIGHDVVGEIQSASNPAQRMSVNGWQEGTFHCDAQRCDGPSMRSAKVYVNSDFLYGICITGYCGGYDNLTLMPTSGAWMIQDEKTGRPGRGVFLDVQDSTIIVQTSDYLVNGEPTFHLGASTLQSSKSVKEDTTASMSLFRYAGGRYFGGPAQSGSEVANAGNLALNFSPFTNNSFTDFGGGNISLPGEGSKALRRLELEPVPDGGLEQFLGEYLLIWDTARGKQTGWVRLTQVKDIFAMNDDGKIQCYRSSSPTNLYCALLPTPNIKQDWIGSAGFKIQPFNRNISNRNFVMRTRDRHGNWLGLGAVNLPGLAIPAQ